MRRLETEFTPDECARILRMSIRQEWGRYEPVRGRVNGRFFRLVLQEYVPSASVDSYGTGVGCVIYGRMYPEGSGSVIHIWEFARALDPGSWLKILPFLILTVFFWPVPVQIRLMFLLFNVVGFAATALMYRKREDKYKSLVVNLRWFLRKTLDAKEVV